MGNVSQQPRGVIMQHRLATIVAFFTSFIMAHQASATALAPGGVVFPAGTTSAASPELVAGVVENDNLIPFVLDPDPNAIGLVDGNVQNRVSRSQNLGDLIFAPRIRDTTNIEGNAPTFAILGFDLFGFGNFATDVDFRTDSQGDKGPNSISRSADGNMLSFTYADPLLIDAFNPPGRQQESLFPSILTNAKDFDTTGRMIVYGRAVDAPIGGGIDPTGDIINVGIANIAVPVPEPASLVLLALGLLATQRRQR